VNGAGFFSAPKWDRHLFLIFKSLRTYMSKAQGDKRISVLGAVIILTVIFVAGAVVLTMKQSGGSGTQDPAAIAQLAECLTQKGVKM